MNALQTSILSVPLLVLVACSNPAADVPVAQSVEPEKSATANGSQVVEGTPLAIDLAQSRLEFVGSKVTGKHDGGFRVFSGTIHLAEAGPVASKVDIQIDMGSTFVDHPKLENHLKSADFFEVATYPTASFSSSSIEAGEGGVFTVTGTLDLHGVKKDIRFPASIEIGDASVKASAEFSINRKEFNILYPGRPDDLIRDEVVIRFDVVAPRG